MVMRCLECPLRVVYFNALVLSPSPHSTIFLLSRGTALVATCSICTHHAITSKHTTRATIGLQSFCRILCRMFRRKPCLLSSITTSALSFVAIPSHHHTIRVCANYRSFNTSSSIQQSINSGPQNTVCSCPLSISPSTCSSSGSQSHSPEFQTFLLGLELMCSATVEKLVILDPGSRTNEGRGNVQTLFRFSQRWWLFWSPNLRKGEYAY